MFFWKIKKKMSEGFDKMWNFLIEHLKANKGELRIILWVLKF